MEEEGKKNFAPTLTQFADEKVFFYFHFVTSVDSKTWNIPEEKVILLYSENDV